VRLAFPDRERAGAAALTAAVTLAIGWALIAGLAVPLAGPTAETLRLFAVADPVPRPPPPRSVAPRRRVKRAEGTAAPRSLRSQATQVTAPAPIVPVPIPPPVTVAPIAGLGSAPTQGAAPLPGPGTGAGGVGTGRGAGGSGDGDGGGWEDETPPRRIRGRLRDSDFPQAAADAGADGVVSVRYYVETDGRVSGCRVTRSSGNAELDGTTCRLIEKRFRYDPSRDARGHPVRSVVVVDHEWVLDRLPGE